MDSSANDKEFVCAVDGMFSEIPFNKLLGLKVESIGPDGVKISFEMRREFIGHYTRRMLHEGVISSVIDATGSLAAFVSRLEKMQIRSPEATLKRSGPSTIDLRVDFLGPGIGKRFVVMAYTLRIGKKVVVVRIELLNEQNDLIAVGTGTYLVV
jgi:uncharacterized protein (TIGR00369 family)